MLSLKEFEIKMLDLDKSVGICGGRIISTSGKRKDGSKYSDEYDDTNGNEKWDPGETLTYCID